MEKTNRIRIDLPIGSFVIDKDEWDNYKHNYTNIFMKLMQEIGQDSRIDYVYFGYCPELNGKTIQIFTTNCTLMYPNLCFDDNHENDNEVVYSVIGKWRDLLSEDEVGEVERVWGVFEGKKIAFKRVWGGYRFTDDEVKELLAGKEITIDKTDKNGNKITGKLAQQDYKNWKFYGFTPIFKNEFKPKGLIKYKSFGEHEFTKEELEKLSQGKKVYIKGLYSRRKNKYYDAFVYYDKKEDKLKPEFPKKNNGGTVDE